jgi:hypothetical protein
MCGSLARTKHRASARATFLNGETRPCWRFCKRRRSLTASRRSSERSARRMKSHPCTGNRSCSHRLMAGREAVHRSQTLIQSSHQPRRDSSGQTPGTFAQKQLPTHPPSRHSTSHRRSRTEPDRPVRRRSTGNVRWIGSCFDCAEASYESPDSFLAMRTVSLRGSVEIRVTKGLLHVVFGKRFAVDFQIRVNEEVQRLACLARDQVHVAPR